MAGIKALSKIQLGREVTPGTEVVATTVWRGMGALADNLEFVEVEEDIGFISPVNRTYISKFEGGITFVDTPATFQQILHLLDAGIGSNAGVADGAGTDFIYTYTLDTTAQTQVLKTYTVEGGNNQQEEQGLFGLVQSFSLTGVGGEALMMSADWVTRQINPGTFTGSVSVPVVEEVLFSKGKLFLDAVSGTIGTTQVTNTLLAGTVDVTTGNVVKYTADGSLDYSFQQFTMPEILVSVTFEHNASAVAEKLNWRNETPRLARLIFEGSTFATPGTAFSVHTLIVDLAGKWRSFDELGEQDGNSIVTGVFRGAFDATASFFAEFKVANELSAVP